LQEPLARPVGPPARSPPCSFRADAQHVDRLLAQFRDIQQRIHPAPKSVPAR
jgi:hypothetical protein